MSGEWQRGGLIDGTFRGITKSNSGSSQRPVKMLLVKTGLLFEPCDMFCLMDLLNLFALTLGGTAMYFVDSITVECG